MDLYAIPEPDRSQYPDGYRFSWIAFDVDNPDCRVLFDCHPPKGPHIHVDGQPEVLVHWVSIENTEEEFFKKVQDHFGHFIVEDEEE